MAGIILAVDLYLLGTRDRKADLKTIWIAHGCAIAAAQPSCAWLNSRNNDTASSGGDPLNGWQWMSAAFMFFVNFWILNYHVYFGSLGKPSMVVVVQIICPISLWMMSYHWQRQKSAYHVMIT